MINLEEENDLTLHRALDEGNTDLIKDLLSKQNMSLNRGTSLGITPLTKAILDNLPKMVELLLQQPDIAVNRLDNWHNTPLHFAVIKENLTLMELLLNHPDTNLDLTNRPFNKSAIEIAEDGHLLNILKALKSNYSTHAFGDQLEPEDPFTEQDRDTHFEYPGEQFLDLNLT